VHTPNLITSRDAVVDTECGQERLNRN